MKTTLLFLLIAFNAAAQFLSLPKSSVISSLQGKIEFTEGVNSEGNFISVPNLSQCACIFIFDKNNICRKQIITALSNTSLVDLITDLDNKHYLQSNNTSWHEEEYGLVQVKRDKNTFTFTYE